MLTSLIFCLWTISCHLSLSLLTPTTLIALAHIQANKARAVAHALQARAKYRNVFHKPRFGLEDARLIRKPRQLNSKEENLVETNFANDEFNINDNGIDFTPDILQEDDNALDETVGMVKKSDYQHNPEAPDVVCVVNEHAPSGNPLLIPKMYPTAQINLRHNNDQDIAQRLPNSSPSNSRDANPHFFNHGFAHKFSKTVSHELVPSQGDVHNQIVINPPTHTTQLVNPPVHVNVMQNQNSAVIPQQTQQLGNTGTQFHSHGGGCPQCHAGLAHAHSGFGHAGNVHSGFGHGTSVNQAQSIQSHNSGWPQNHLNIAQNQNVHTRRENEDDDRKRPENLSSPYFDKEPEMILQAVRIPPEMTPSGGDDAKLGTFLNDESKESYDQDQSQNRQSDKNIEDRQKNPNIPLPITLPILEDEHNDGSHPEKRMKFESSEEYDNGYMNSYGGGEYYGGYEEEEPMKKFFDKENKKIKKKILKIKKKMEKLLHKSDKKEKKKQYNVYNYNYYGNNKYDDDKYGYGNDNYDKYGHHHSSYGMKDKYHKKSYDKYGSMKPNNMYSYDDAHSMEVPDLPTYSLYPDKSPHNSYNNPYSNSKAYPYDKNTYYYRQAQEMDDSTNTAKFTENDPMIPKGPEILPENHASLLGQPMAIHPNQQIENNNTEQEEGVRSLPDPLLGYIVRVPERQEYRRTARSIDKSTDYDLSKILLAKKAMINTIKKHANGDKNLMMIGNIGDSFIKDWEKKDHKNRTRRDIARDSYSLKKLFTNPATKFDVPKTLENLGVVTRETFEHESTPLYYVRKIVGSAKDAVMAAMKIPNQNIITPSQYSIVNPQDERISSINPEILSSTDDFVDNQITSTFEKVGSVLRDSVKSGQDVLSHIGDMANHGKDAIYSFQYVTPRLMLNKLHPILQRPMDKTVFISPRIMDVYDERERVGSNRDLELDNRIIKERPTRSLTNDTNPSKDPDTVGAGLFPDILLHPFMNHVNPKKEVKPISTSNTTSGKPHDTNQYRDDIVGSINPLIFERMFNETVPMKNDTKDLHGLFHVSNNETSQNNGEGGDGEVVSTSMTMEGAMLEPFLGKISAESFEGVFHNYQSPQGYDDSPDDDVY